MNPQIAAMIDGIIGREKGYVNHPSDPGGATIWGITERVARANGYTGDMRVMPQAVARDIYYREYIVKPGFLGIAEIDPAVAEEVIDSGVNAGQKRAALWFQQALNVLNRRGVDYADIAEDGIIGRGSIAAFQALRRKRGDAGARRLMLKALNGLQFMHYYGLAKGGTKFEDFMPGWVDGRIGALG
ncbi:glycoside hydrolase family 108 protein [Sphingopyxis sp. NFH-91]|uniref:glycoside hydrolase family 108 protein n=1 Tax=Sphingopyxis sp. NFH-91 TaxID=2744457 RepID=UPI001F3AC000|nr:glycosyl hydrolase 108 family protein [Sphingopyxis sp. NFH-91]